MAADRAADGHAHGQEGTRAPGRCHGLSCHTCGEATGEPAGEARTVKKSLVQPTRYWSAGRYWPGTSAVSGPPGLRVVSSWTHSGLMSSSMATRAPWLASTEARSAGTADMLAT